MFTFMKDLNRSQKKALWICFYAFSCNGSLSLLLGSVMPDLKAAYHLTDTFSGMLMSAHTLGNLIAGFTTGLLPLYLGRRRSIMMVSGCSAVGYTMALLFGSSTWLLLAILLVGLGRGSITNFCSQTINNHTNGNPAATNLLHASFAIGAILLPFIFLFLRDSLSWKAGVLYVVALYIALEVFWAVMPIDDDHPVRGAKKDTTLVFMKNRSFLVLALMMFCYLCSEYAINGWLVTYIQNKESLIAALTASGTSVSSYSQTMASLLWALILIGRLTCAVIAPKVGVKRLMFCCSIGMALFFSVMLASNTIPMVTLSVAGMGLCMSGICPMIYSDAVGFTNRYPMAVSMILAIGCLGGIAMPTIVGLMAETFGFTGGMSAILVTITLLVIFSALNLFCKPVPVDQA